MLLIGVCGLGLYARHLIIMSHCCCATAARLSKLSLLARYEPAKQTLGVFVPVLANPQRGLMVAHAGGSCEVGAKSYHLLLGGYVWRRGRIGISTKSIYKKLRYKPLMLTSTSYFSWYSSPVIHHVIYQLGRCAAGGYSNAYEIEIVQNLSA